MSDVKQYLCVGGVLDGQLSPAILHGTSFKARNPGPAPVRPVYDAKLTSTNIIPDEFTVYRLVTFHWQRSNGYQTQHNFWVPAEFAEDQAQGRIYVLDEMALRYSETPDMAMQRWSERGL